MVCANSLNNTSLRPYLNCLLPHFKVLDKTILFCSRLIEKTFFLNRLSKKFALQIIFQKISKIHCILTGYVCPHQNVYF